MSEDLRTARDDIEADMAAHQRRTGKEPTAVENAALASDAMRELEIRRAEVKPTPTTDDAAIAQRTAEQINRRFERDGKHGTYLIDQSTDDDTKMRPTTEPERWFMIHALPRLKLLMGHMETGPLGQPSWHQRVLAVLELRSRVPGLREIGAISAAEDLEQRFTFELVQLLDDSSRVFGDWKADPGTRVSVQVR